MADTLTLDRLQKAVRQDAAIRRNVRLQPAGGPGDKVFPPTYEGGEYATEQRVIEGLRRPCVLLDSVQSQANRLEMALLEAHRDGRIKVPVVSVDFGAVGLSDVGVVTSLEAPHRLADAILRDSTLDGVGFRDSAVGKLLDTASVANATGLFEVCPTALVFGIWDSAGPRGGLGTKFARALVSEVVGVDAEVGVRPSSRIDPLGIELDAGPLYKTEDGGWTLDSKKAEKAKGKPVFVGKEGKPSEANHGNVTPSLKNERKQPHHGGVTFAYARQSTVLSLPALRRLRFPGSDGSTSPDRDLAARTTLAALGLAASALSAVVGTDLRSRCLLVPEVEHPARLELITADGAVEAFALAADEACALLERAVSLAEAAGLPWRVEGVQLTPNPQLVELVMRSRKSKTNAGAEG